LQVTTDSELVTAEFQSTQVCWDASLCHRVTSTWHFKWTQPSKCPEPLTVWHSVMCQKTLIQRFLFPGMCHLTVNRVMKQWSAAGYQTTWHYTPECDSLYIHCCKNPQSDRQWGKLSFWGENKKHYGAWTEVNPYVELGNVLTDLLACTWIIPL